MPTSSAIPAPARTRSTIRASSLRTYVIKAAACGASNSATSESSVSSVKKPCAPTVSNATSTSSRARSRAAMPSCRLAGHHRRSQWPMASLRSGSTDPGTMPTPVSSMLCRPSAADARADVNATCPDSPRMRQSQSARDTSVKVIWADASPGGSSIVQDSTAPLTSSTAASGVAVVPGPVLHRPESAANLIRPPAIPASP